MFGVGMKKKTFPARCMNMKSRLAPHPPIDFHNAGYEKKSLS